LGGCQLDTDSNAGVQEDGASVFVELLPYLEESALAAKVHFELGGLWNEGSSPESVGELRAVWRRDGWIFGGMAGQKKDVGVWDEESLGRCGPRPDEIILPP
jgi:hypothetical protein